MHFLYIEMHNVNAHEWPDMEEFEVEIELAVSVLVFHAASRYILDAACFTNRSCSSEPFIIF